MQLLAYLVMAQDRRSFQCFATTANGPSEKFLAPAKKSLVTEVMRTRFGYVAFFA
jgi:hypothetical protein